MIETLGKVQGEWRAVFTEDDVEVGQRVRYGGSSVGYKGCKRVIGIHNGRKWVFDSKCGPCSNCDFSFWGDVEAFFPIVEEKEEKKKAVKRKVAKVEVFRDQFSSVGRWFFSCDIGSKKVRISAGDFKSKKLATSEAKSFCKKIGYEFELVK
jgi:hypothetical protein